MNVTNLFINNEFDPAISRVDINTGDRGSYIVAKEVFPSILYSVIMQWEEPYNIVYTGIRDSTDVTAVSCIHGTLKKYKTKEERAVMSNFFNKIKQGVSDAGKKAQNTVEWTTLKFQLSAKEKDIEKNYTEIGRIVHQSLEIPGGVIPSTEIQKYRDAIVELEQEVEELQRKIQHLQNLKECGCGKMLPSDATYCPFCGQQFQTVIVQPSASETSFPKSTYCTKCGEPADFMDQFCRSCGNKLLQE